MLVIERFLNYIRVGDETMVLFGQMKEFFGLRFTSENLSCILEWIVVLGQRDKEETEHEWYFALGAQEAKALLEFHSVSSSVVGVDIP